MVHVSRLASEGRLPPLSPTQLATLLQGKLNSLVERGEEIVSITALCEGGVKDIFIVHNTIEHVNDKPSWHVFPMLADEETLQGVPSEITEWRVHREIYDLRPPVILVVLNEEPTAEAIAHGRRHDGVGNILICHHVQPTQQASEED